MGVSNRVSSICKKIIKPCVPTPPSLRCHNLSYLDQMMGGTYVPFAFFYPRVNSTSDDVSQRLEKSLSKNLACYYPLAGKLKGNVSVECNDSGVELFTTKIDGPMSNIMNDPYGDKQDLVFPKGIPCVASYEGSLAVAQVSHFDCGGIAVSACMTHKIGDAHTMLNFIKDWATLARNPNSQVQSPDHFSGSSVFPPSEDLSNLPYVEPVREECLSKCFVFSPSKLAALKSRVVNQVQNPTDTEVVSAFIYQRAMATKKQISGGSIRPSVLVQAASLRPPLPINTTGNIGSFFSILTTQEKEMDLARVVGKLRKAKDEYRQKYSGAKEKQLLAITVGLYRDANDYFVNDCYDVYRFSSVTKFAFNDVDFGWGKPERVSLSSNAPVRNMFGLISNKRGGVEVISYMKEQDMLALDKDEELHEFTSPCS